MHGVQRTGGRSPAGSDHEASQGDEPQTGQEASAKLGQRMVTTDPRLPRPRGAEPVGHRRGALEEGDNQHSQDHREGQGLQVARHMEEICVLGPSLPGGPIPYRMLLLPDIVASEGQCKSVASPQPVEAESAASADSREVTDRSRFHWPPRAAIQEPHAFAGKASRLDERLPLHRALDDQLQPPPPLHRPSSVSQTDSRRAFAAIVKAPPPSILMRVEERSLGEAAAADRNVALEALRLLCRPALEAAPRVEPEGTNPDHGRILIRDESSSRPGTTKRGPQGQWLPIEMCGQTCCERYTDESQDPPERICLRPCVLQNGHVGRHECSRHPSDEGGSNDDSGRPHPGLDWDKMLGNQRKRRHVSHAEK